MLVIRRAVILGAVAFSLLSAYAEPALCADSQEKSKHLQVGAKAPDFTLPAQDGSNVSLSDFAEKKAVVLYFYPKDDVLVCKKEACLFRDSYQSFTGAGAEVIGVSSDNLQS